MAIGPVQLVVLGFERPDLHGEIVAELERLRRNDTVHVLDALAVHRTLDGDLEVEHLSDLTQDQANEIGTVVGALIGLGVDGADTEVAAAGVDEAVEEELLVDDSEVWDVLEDIPPGSAAALILLEHHWAVPLRDAVARAGGFRIADGIISPRDLVAFGLHTTEEADRLDALDRPGAATAS